MTYQTGSRRPRNLRAKESGRKKRLHGSNIGLGPSQQAVAVDHSHEQSSVIGSPSSHSERPEAEQPLRPSESHSTALWGPPFVWMECDVRDFPSSTFPLHRALQLGKEDLILDLIASGGADPNLQTEDGLTPLHIAVRQGRSESCLWDLLQGGAKISTPDAEGNNPLHWAVRWHWGACEAILTDKWAFSKRNKDGLCPLHLLLICYRMGLCEPKDLDLFLNSPDICVPDESIPNLSTGESPVEHLLSTLSRSHDWTTRNERTAWWDMVISESPSVPSAWFFYSIITCSERAQRILVFPGSTQSLLESLLEDIPIRVFSRTESWGLLTLLKSLFIQDYWSGLDSQITLLMESINAPAWRLNDDILCTADVLVEILEVADQFSQSWVCNKSNRTLLMKAIQDIQLPLVRPNYHPAITLVNFGSDGFLSEQDGRFPIVVAAERGLQRVVEHILDKDMHRNDGHWARYTIFADNDRDDGQQQRRLYWPAWEDAKRTVQGAQAIAAVEPIVGTNRIEGMSPSVQFWSLKAAMKVVLEKFAKDTGPWIRDNTTEKRVQLAFLIKRCLYYNVEIEDWVYRRLVDLCAVGCG